MAVACHPARSTTTSPPAPRPSSAPPRAEATDPEPKLEIGLAVAEEPSPRWRVRIALTAPSHASKTWTYGTPGLARDSLRIRDDEGELAFTFEDAPPYTVELERAARGVLVLEYDVLIESPVAWGTGESLLLLPKALLSQSLPVELVVTPCGEQRPRAASSFGPGSTFADTIPLVELRTADYLCGDLDVATMQTRLGRDSIVSTEDWIYDMRWPATEVALVRTEVDGFFGAIETPPFTTFIVGNPDAVHLPRATLRSRSLRVAMGPAAPWESSARLAVAQALVQRWLGGRFPIEDIAEERGLEPTWWSIGWARFVALEVLRDLRLLTPKEYAAAINEAERVVAEQLPPTPSRGLRERRAAALGLLSALTLDRRLQAVGSAGMVNVLREVLGQVDAAGQRKVPLARLSAPLDDRLGEREGQRFLTWLHRPERPAVPRDALAPCHRPKRSSSSHADLGLSDPRWFGEALGDSILDFDPGGPAAQAGVKPDDELVAIRVASDDPEELVVLEVARGEELLAFEVEPRMRTIAPIVWVPTRQRGSDECGD